jgi:hypothetical protein
MQMNHVVLIACHSYKHSDLGCNLELTLFFKHFFFKL